MVPNSLVALIQKNTKKLGDEWAKRVKESENMRTYRKQPAAELSKRNQRFFRSLATWLEEGASNEKITTYFSRVGRERYHESIPLFEINFGIILAKSVLMDFIMAEGFFSNTMQVYQTLELMTLVSRFFDFGYFAISQEYIEEMHTTLKKLKLDNINQLCPFHPGPTTKELEAIFGIKFDIKKR